MFLTDLILMHCPLAFCLTLTDGPSMSGYRRTAHVYRLVDMAVRRFNVARIHWIEVQILTAGTIKATYECWATTNGGDTIHVIDSWCLDNVIGDRPLAVEIPCGRKMDEDCDCPEGQPTYVTL